MTTPSRESIERGVDALNQRRFGWLKTYTVGMRVETKHGAEDHFIAGTVTAIGRRNYKPEVEVHWDHLDYLTWESVEVLRPVQSPRIEVAGPDEVPDVAIAMRHHEVIARAERVRGAWRVTLTVTGQVIATIPVTPTALPLVKAVLSAL
jgi:hypothetical protein